ncbi:Mu transposase C-terminal domain-containing protein [Pseudarthrobacter sp. RMG13]|uniref:Mu transposase C-terminal domain-containing protein n=1 Tax=Pseudarthrobacter humi TaxID=2952523 RepID=A0ABT1LVP1_9MICC|nr:Mu transposase C-terminal domain-containing protein [Pseudarthrobacter humi]MCP9002091.1 Mu transposase C-terminal domain-containing protein [Pseudarthrobacter humi]
MTASDTSLRIGDEVMFRGVTYRLTGLDGDIALLAVAGESPVVIKLGALFADSSFKVTSARPAERRKLTGQSMLFDSLPPDVQQKTRRLESHITEILDGLPCDATPGQMPNPAYSVRLSLRQRELAKLSELREQGEAVSISSLQRLRLAYEKQGILGLVDQRLIRQTRITGQTDQRVVDTVLSVLEANTGQTSGTMDRLIRQVRKQLDAEHGPGAVPLPSRATLHRLMGRLAEGRHATGSARTRRTLAQQPAGPFGSVYPVRPGELMQIDSTPLDVAVELDDGVIGRVELTAMVDIATRSIPAAVIRPTTKAADAALLLARCVTPELMRPGWARAASMAASALPYRSMKSIDERLAAAAAKPVIMPETIVCDHGKAYLSHAFRNACRSLGVSLQPAHPDTPTDKPVIERTLQSIGTLFAQYVTGYLGSSVERRGRNAQNQAVFSLLEIQDLLDEWIITAWQNRPHEGLRDPFTPSRVLTPNEKYAALLSVSGYVPVPLEAEQYLELLPAETRVINSYGVKIRHRVYDCEDLNPYRGQKSGMKLLRDLWEVRYDTYDASCVWVRNHHDGGWITAYWRQLNATRQPFGEDIWERGRQIASGRGTASPSEQEITQAVDQLLDKASPSPGKRRPGHAKTRRIVARNAAATAARRSRPTDSTGPEPDHVLEAETEPRETAGHLAEVIPLKVYNPQERADEWW